MRNKIFVYKKPNAMIGHKYTDDVAITKAVNKEEALIKFKQYYDCDIEDIKEVMFNAHGTMYTVAIITDY